MDNYIEGVFSKYTVVVHNESVDNVDKHFCTVTVVVGRLLENKKWDVTNVKIKSVADNDIDAYSKAYDITERLYKLDVQNMNSPDDALEAIKNLSTDDVEVTVSKNECDTLEV